MWSLQTHGPNSVRFSIPADDVVFFAVLQRGPTVHADKVTYVRCLHVAEWDTCGSRLGLTMSLLDATAIEAKYADFVGDGLMGRWQLVKPEKGQEPRIKLLHAFNNGSVIDFVNEALGDDNPEWVRRSYAPLLAERVSERAADHVAERVKSA